MKCQTYKCHWYHSCNPYGSRAYCGATDRWVWCDEVEDCKWFRERADTGNRLHRLEEEVEGLREKLKELTKVLVG